MEPGTGIGANDAEIAPGPFTYKDLDCPAEVLVRLLGDKWKARVLIYLAIDGTGRFSALQRSLGGLHHATLGRVLRELQESGLVERVAHDEKRQRVDYFLSEKGRAIVGLLGELDRFSRVYLNA
jgi:DNA-binding HxlR family transcriptional regulator